MVRVRWRWAALFFISCFVIGGYFNFDAPALLMARILVHFEISEQRYSLLYTVYSLPNIFAPLAIAAAGLFAYPGKAPMLIISMLVVCLGQALLAFGGYDDNYSTMVIGRCIFGLGSETMYALKATYTVLWFHDQEISLAMGLNSAFPFMFSFLAGIMYP